MTDILTSIALCWRVERRDGVAIGLTDHDRDLLIDGLLHRAAPGMAPSAIVRSDGLEADTMDVAGALSSVAIAERDLLAGRWDGARVEMFAIDWATLGDRVALGAGTVGEVALDERGFTAELRGAAAALDRAVAEETAPECRAELGDRRCRVAMAGRRGFVRVVSVAGVDVTLDVSEPVANGWGGGALRWLGGANCGLESAVARSAGAVATLRVLPPFAIAPGTLVEIGEGCDKSVATCAARFGNVANFRGEPYLPGIDLLTRYPGA